MTTRAASITVDLDGLRNYTRIHGLTEEAPTGLDDPIFGVALERMLELFDRHGVRATLFCVGEDLAHAGVAELLRQAAAAGHELGNHSEHHLYDLRVQDAATIAAEIALTGARLEAIAGRPTAGFRVPGYNVSPGITRALVAQGYRYDSSLFPCPLYYAAKGLVMASLRLRGRPGQSQMTLPQTLTAPIVPYRADVDRPWRRASASAPHLWEVPMCLVPGLRFPLIGTSLHLLGASGFGALLPALASVYKNVLQLEFHGIDFMDGSDHGVPAQLRSAQPDLRVPVGRKLETWRGIFERVRGRYEFVPLVEAVDFCEQATS